jgi:hypothetical protein
MTKYISNSSVAISLSVIGRPARAAAHRKTLSTANPRLQRPLTNGDCPASALKIVICPTSLPSLPRCEVQPIPGPRRCPTQPLPQNLKQNGFSSVRFVSRMQTTSTIYGPSARYTNGRTSCPPSVSYLHLTNAFLPAAQENGTHPPVPSPGLPSKPLIPTPFPT